MEARLTGLDRAEALRYMGWRGGPAPEELLRTLDRCEALLRRTARPRAVWRMFELLPDGTLAGTGFCPEGRDIRAHLAGCGQVILMGATLGAEAETLIRRTQAADMALALALDGCASAAIENVCDNLCADLAAALAPKRLTGRFSPGYGDMPLEQQETLCRVLDVERRIGVSLTAGGLMIPQKSVTALIGVSDGPGTEERRCDGCGMFANCEIRKAGGRCGGT